jgi:hypothetical protein
VLLALLAAHHIFHISRIKVKMGVKNKKGKGRGMNSAGSELK